MPLMQPNGFMELPKHWLDMTVYYAHPMSWYGTEDEVADLACIHECFKDCLNPNQEGFKEAVKQARLRGASPMEPFERAIRDPKIGAVVYRAFKDGVVGAGVAQEIMWGKVFGKEIIKIGSYFGKDRVLYSNPLFNISEALTIQDTRDRLNQGVM